MDKRIACNVVNVAVNQFFNTLSNLDDSDEEFSSSGDDDQEMLTSIAQAGSRETPIRITNYVERVVQSYNTVQFQQNFRMSTEAFEYLLGRFNSYINEENISTSISLEKQLLAVIWLLATPDSYRSIGERFNLAKSTLSKFFFRVIIFLTKIANTIVKFPNEEEKSVIKNCFETNNKIKGVIGAIDGSYIPIKAPADQKPAYTNRKCFQSVTLQAICDHRLKYLDCYVGFPSSVHDNRIFRNSPIYKKVVENNIFFNEGEKILGDKAYPVEEWCIPPFIDRGNLTDVQKFFNYKHASARQVIERSFALLFGRFRRLRYIDMNVTEYIPSTIIAACVLHNICIDFEDGNIEAYISEGQLFAVQNVPTDAETVMDAIITDTRLGLQERNNMALEVWEACH